MSVETRSCKSTQPLTLPPQRGCWCHQKWYSNTNHRSCLSVFHVNLLLQSRRHSKPSSESTRYCTHSPWPTQGMSPGGCSFSRDLSTTSRETRVPFPSQPATHCTYASRQDILSALSFSGRFLFFFFSPSRDNPGIIFYMFIYYALLSTTGPQSITRIITRMSAAV